MCAIVRDAIAPYARASRGVREHVDQSVTEDVAHAIAPGDALCARRTRARSTPSLDAGAGVDKTEEIFIRFVEIDRVATARGWWGDGYVLKVTDAHRCHRRGSVFDALASGTGDPY